MHPISFENSLYRISFYNPKYNPIQIFQKQRLKQFKTVLIEMFCQKNCTGRIFFISLPHSETFTQLFPVQRNTSSCHFVAKGNASNFPPSFKCIDGFFDALRGNHGTIAGHPLHCWVQHQRRKFS